MKQVVYINRYGDNIVFEEINENTVKMSGFDHYRYGGNFIDPSGGPFIKVGIDIGRYFDDGKTRKIKKIHITEEGEKALLIY